MSLEQVIAENTSAIRELIAAIGKANTGAACNATAADNAAPAKTEEAAAKKQVAEKPASTEPAATQPTAEQAAVQDTKASKSEPTAQEVQLLSADELASAVKNAIGKSGREKVVALLTEYNAKKAGEVATEKRAEFDAKLISLAA